MKRILIVLLMLFCFRAGLVLAESVELTEKMTPEYYDETYRPHYDAAKALFDAKDYAGAAVEYRKAADLQKFAAHRSANLRNSAYSLLCYAQTGIELKVAGASLEEAERVYLEASEVLVLADKVGGRDESRAQTRKHIKMGLSWLRHLKANPEKLLVKRRDL